MAANQQIRATSRTGAGCLTIVVTGFFGAIGWLFVLSGGAMFWQSRSWFTSIFVLVGAVFGIGGLIGVGYGIRMIWLGQVLGRMVLELSNEQPILLGGVQVVRFRREGGHRRASDAPAVSAQLTCHESVTYRQGTDDHTVKHELFRGPLTVYPEPAPGTVAGRVEIVVPLTHPPTMALPHNRIVWQVELKVRVAGVPDDDSAFAVHVAPAVAPRAMAGGAR